MNYTIKSIWFSFITAYEVKLTLIHANSVSDTAQDDPFLWKTFGLMFYFYKQIMT